MKIIGALLVLIAVIGVKAAEPWQTALAGMPLQPATAELNESNCVPLMLAAFKSNEVVKALIFMPGATDEMYFFHRVQAPLTNGSPTLLDAIRALDAHTRIHATFRPPFLLLHTEEDPLVPQFAIKNPAVTAQLRDTRFVGHALFDDRDWDSLLPLLKKSCRLEIIPRLHSRNSYHFYRHSFAGWNLSGWEAMEAVALAGKTRFVVDRKVAIFEADERVRGPLMLEKYPK